MTAPSRINVQGDTLSVYWRNEMDADWGYKALRNAGHPALVGHEMTMFAPATDKGMSGIHMQNNLKDVDYGATLRLLGASHQIVELTQQSIAREHARDALGSLGVSGDGMHIANGTAVANNAAMGAVAEAARTV